MLSQVTVTVNDVMDAVTDEFYGGLTAILTIVVPIILMWFTFKWVLRTAIVRRGDLYDGYTARDDIYDRAMQKRRNKAKYRRRRKARVAGY
jgi:hypothetical protein